MQTSSWFSNTGRGRIGISRSTPRRTPGGYRIFRGLAPGPWFKCANRAAYERRFLEEILGALDPARTWDRLHELAGGAEPVLLCWERPSRSRRRGVFMGSDCFPGASPTNSAS